MGAAEKHNAFAARMGAKMPSGMPDALYVLALTESTNVRGLEGETYAATTAYTIPCRYITKSETQGQQLVAGHEQPVTQYIFQVPAKYNNAGVTIGKHNRLQVAARGATPQLILAVQNVNVMDGVTLKVIATLIET